jgi:hypothetical protein
LIMKETLSNQHEGITSEEERSTGRPEDSKEYVGR